MSRGSPCSAPMKRDREGAGDRVHDERELPAPVAAREVEVALDEGVARAELARRDGQWSWRAPSVVGARPAPRQRGRRLEALRTGSAAIRAPSRTIERPSGPADRRSSARGARRGARATGRVRLAANRAARSAWTASVATVPFGDADHAPFGRAVVGRGSGGAGRRPAMRAVVTRSFRRPLGGLLLDVLVEGAAGVGHEGTFSRRRREARGRAATRCLELVGVSLDDQPAPVEDRDPVAEAVGLRRGRAW